MLYIFYFDLLYCVWCGLKWLFFLNFASFIDVHHLLLLFVGAGVNY